MRGIFAKGSFWVAIPRVCNSVNSQDRSIASLFLHALQDNLDACAPSGVHPALLCLSRGQRSSYLVYSACACVIGTKPLHQKMRPLVPVRLQPCLQT